MSRSPRRKALALAVAVLLACLYAPALARADDENHDPWERMNRGIFWFNEKLDKFLLEPVAKGWNFILPDLLQESIDNALNNGRLPIDLVNNLLQGKPREGFDTVSRFLLNSTLGMGGLFDPASQIGLGPTTEDFGQTLGRWGVGPGPYLVLPLYGPSTVRDGTGLAVDSVMRVWPFFVDREVIWVYNAVAGINTRSLLLEEIATAREGALDWYAAVRNAYLQRRAALIADTTEGEEEDEEDLYYFDFEDE